MKNKKIKTSAEGAGFSIIEILVAAGIISLALAGLAGLVNFTLQMQNLQKENLITTNLAVEAMEAAGAVRNGSWANISSLLFENPYHPVKDGSPLQWSLVSGAETINNFSRQIVFSQVFRDSDDDIVTNGGVLDPNTKKITVNVSWTEHGNAYNVSLTSYLTNWRL